MRAKPVVVQVLGTAGAPRRQGGGGPQEGESRERHGAALRHLAPAVALRGRRAVVVVLVPPPPDLRTGRNSALRSTKLSVPVLYTR